MGSASEIQLCWRIKRNRCFLLDPVLPSIHICMSSSISVNKQKFWWNQLQSDGGNCAKCEDIGEEVSNKFTSSSAYHLKRHFRTMKSIRHAVNNSNQWRTCK